MILKILGGLYLLGLVGMFVGWAWLRRRAFAEGIAWGLLCVFVPFGSLVFLFRRWDDARDPFIASALGFACVLPLVLANPARFTRNLTAGMAENGPRGAVLRAAFPPEPARRPSNAWLDPSAEEKEPAETDPDVDPEPTPLVPSDAFEHEAAIAARAEQLDREARQAAYDRHRAEADALFKDLNARRTRLRPDDAKAVAAFNAEAARYAALLAQTRGERVALDRPPSTVVAASPAPAAALPTSPRPGVAPRRAGTTPVAARPGGDPAADPYRHSLDAARAALNAANGAEDPEGWADEVHGAPAPVAAGATGTARSPSPRR